MAPSCHHTDPNRSDSMCVLLSFLTFFDYSHCIRHGMPRILFDLIVRFWIQLNDVSGGTKSPTVKIFTAQNKENKQKRFQDITKWQYVTICDNMTKARQTLKMFPSGFPPPVSASCPPGPGEAAAQSCSHYKASTRGLGGPRGACTRAKRCEEIWRSEKIWKL